MENSQALVIAKENEPIVVDQALMNRIQNLVQGIGGCAAYLLRASKSNTGSIEINCEPWNRKFSGIRDFISTGDAHFLGVPVVDQYGKTISSVVVRIDQE